MNFKLNSLVIAVCAISAGCATKPPEAVMIPAPQPVQAVVKNYEPAIQSAPVVVQIPEWYISTPAKTAQSIFTAGTATSTNLSMATQKAMLDADIKLAFQIESSVKAMLKSYQVDLTNETVEHTELIAKKVSAIIVNGHVQADMQIVQEGNRFRVFILMRYPLSGVNYFGDKVRAAAIAAQAKKNIEKSEAELDATPASVVNEAPVVAPAENAAPATVNNTVPPTAQRDVLVPVDVVPAPAVSSVVTKVVTAPVVADAATKLKSEIDAALSGN